MAFRSSSLDHVLRAEPIPTPAHLGEQYLLLEVFVNEPHIRQLLGGFPCLRTPLLLCEAEQEREQNFGLGVETPQ